MFVISLLSIMAAAAGTTWSFLSQRDRERELQFVGRQYREAIERYGRAHAGQAQPFPTELSQLLGGSGPLGVRRFLRKLYFDPMTGSAEWGLVKTLEGGIVGVYSLSTLRPIRSRSSYALDEATFASARSYQDVKYVVAASLLAPTPPPASNAPKWIDPDAPSTADTRPHDDARDGAPLPKWPEGHAPVGD
jgi:type II secretory pathway pseudopilin PulG